MQREGSWHQRRKLPRRSCGLGTETKSGFKSHLEGVISRIICATTMGTCQHSISKLIDRRKVTPQVSSALKSL